MRLFAGTLLAVALTGSIWAQQQTDSGSVSAAAQQQTDSGSVGAGTSAAAVVDTPHQRQESFGSGDVIKVSVYDSPELTGNVGVNSEGDIRLPIMRQHIRAAGLTPDELENSVSAALVDEHILVDPIVSVTLV